MPQYPHRALTGLRSPWLIAVASALSALSGCGARTAITLAEDPGTGGTSEREAPALPAGGSLTGGASSGGTGGAGGGAGGVSGIGGANGRAGAPSALDAGVADASVPPPCEAVSESLDELRPAVTLLVDQSRSMASHYPTKSSPDTRWSLVGTALFDPTNGVVKTYQGTVRFGISFFTAHNGFSGGACPILSEVPAATNNYLPLRTLYLGLGPDGNTPTGESINQVVSELKASPDGGQHSIVLVTDGNPNTCANPSSHDGDGQAMAVAATQSAYAAGIDVYVLGISNDIAGSNLQQLANAGKGKNINLIWGVDADAEQPYLAGNSTAGLTAQFAKILAQIPFCEVRLQRDVAQSELSGAHVTLDGQAVPLSPMNGYVLKDSRHLALIGSACTAVKSGAKELRVRISCD